MPYRKLYRNRQEANDDFQPRQWYVEDALTLSWVSGIDVRASNALPLDGLCGFVVRHKPEGHGLRHHYTILVAEGLDEAIPHMERFVAIKELMHCYFVCDDGSATDSQITFDTHMRQFFGDSAMSQSTHVKAEFAALWMAMGVLCPEQRRKNYRALLEKGDIQIQTIVDALRAPEHIVRLLLSDQFEDEIRDILN